MLTFLTAISSCNNTKKPDQTTEQITESIQNTATSVNSIGLENFVIVHAEKNIAKSFAKEIQEAIFDKTGIELAIHTAQEDEAEYEIIVGEVLRMSTKKYYTELNSYSYCDHYYIKIDGKKSCLQLSRMPD